MDRPNQTVLAALFIASIAIGSLSGIGLALAAGGFARDRRWRERWGLWFPSIFGASLAVAAVVFLLLLVTGID